MDVQVYFFGVLRAREAGHYLYTPNGQTLDTMRSPLPWPPHDFDGGLTWNAGAWIVRGQNRRREQARGECLQGDAALRHRNGWTALSWHDFTGDNRGGSNSTIFARGIFTAEEMLELLERHFPTVHARQPGPLNVKHRDPRPISEGT